MTVLGRARAADIAGIVRTAFDPAVRGEVSRLLATGISPALEEQLNWASAGPAGAEERWDCYRHDSGDLGDLGLAGSTPAERHRRRAGPPARARPLPQAGQPAVPAAARRRGRRAPWTARSRAAAVPRASTPAAPAAT